MIKVVRGVSRLVDAGLLLVFVVLFLIGGYSLYDTWLIYDHAQDTSVLKYKPQSVQQAEALREVLPGSVAWLTLDGTGIDYPVMQGADNNEYLNKDPYGSFSLSGSIFLDSRNAGDFSDDYSLLYGHHMEQGAMFGALDDFLDQAYFDAHRDGLLLTADGGRYTLRLFAACLADAAEGRIFAPTENEGPMELIRAEHEVWYEPEEGPVLALSTCRSAETSARIVVFGVLQDCESDQS